MKTCSRCGEEKSHEDFNKRSASPDGLQPLCRSCGNELSRDYYANNSDRLKDSVKENKNRYKARNRDYVYSYLIENPCVDCGITDIRLLEFDHRPGEEKKNGVCGLASWSISLETLKAEIAKCDVRCKNCHTLKTYERLGGTWHDLYLEITEDS